MIHTEAWYQPTASNEARNAIERLKRGDDSAFIDIWKLGKRGGLGDVVKGSPGFLVEVMEERHNGLGRWWIFRAKQLNAALDEDGAQFESRSRDFPKTTPAFQALRELQAASSDIYSERGFFMLQVCFNVWKQADRALTQLAQDWAEYVRKYPDMEGELPNISKGRY